MNFGVILEAFFIFVIAVAALLALVLLIVSLMLFFSEPQQSFSDVERIASENAVARPYSFPDYTCSDFSNSLVGELRDEGWFAFEQTVEAPLANEWCDEVGASRKGNCLHSVVVVAVPIDAVSGKVLTPEEWGRMQYSFFGEAYDCQRCMGVIEHSPDVYVS